MWKFLKCCNCLTEASLNHNLGSFLCHMKLCNGCVGQLCILIERGVVGLRKSNTSAVVGGIVLCPAYKCGVVLVHARKLGW